MIHSASLIVLASTKVGEKNLVLHCLTGQWGRRSFITSVGRGTAMAMYQPLSILDAEIVENPKSSLWRLRSATPVHPLSGIRNSIPKNTMTMFMSEVLYRTIKDEANEEGLFEWCTQSILTLDALATDYSNFHLRWLLEFAGALGFSPSVDDIAPFAGEHLRDISSLLSLSFGESLLLPLSGSSRNGIAESLIRYIGHHTESNIEVRSLRVLRDIFSL